MGQLAKPDSDSGFGGVAGVRGHPSPSRSQAGWWLSGISMHSSQGRLQGAQGLATGCCAGARRPGDGVGMHRLPSLLVPHTLLCPGPVPASVAQPQTFPHASGRERRLAATSALGRTACTAPCLAGRDQSVAGELLLPLGLERGGGHWVQGGEP